MSIGVKLIELERLEQVEVHRWTTFHDLDAHTPLELQDAAMHCLTFGDTDWPFSDGTSPVDKGYSAIHCLKVAGALIAAAIDLRIGMGERCFEGKPLPSVQEDATSGGEK